MYGIPEITEEKIKCEECGKWFKKITHPHLSKKHNLTISEYKSRWSFCNSQPLEATYIKKIRQKNIKENPHLIDNIKNHEEYRFVKGYRYWQGKEVPEQMRIRLASMAINVQSTDEFKKKISNSSKKLWKDPRYRSNVVNGLKRAYTSQELRKRIGAQINKLLEDKEWKEKRDKAIKKGTNTKKYKKYASERAKKMWSNPEIRKKILNKRKNMKNGE